MYKRMIIGYDGSDGARDALVLGLRMAEFEHASIRVVCVYPYEPMGRAADGEYERVVLSDVDAELAGARDAVGNRPDTDFDLVPGLSPARELHRIAEEWPADLVVVGSSDRAGPGQILVGGVGEQTLHGSACPVLVAPRGYRDVAARLGRVGAAFNGSEDSKLALEAAAAIADAAGAELLIVDVVDLGHGFRASHWELYNYEEYRDDLHGVVAGAVANAADALDRPAKTEVPVGDAVDELVKRSRDLDLLVVGSRNYGPVRRLLLGSVSTRLVRQAACPVLVVPRGAHDTTSTHEHSPIDTSA